MEFPTRDEIAQMRRSYGEIGLPDDGLPADPIEGILAWLAEAAANPLIVEPNAMVLATVGPEGVPRARTVLLKSIDARGLTFFTNYESRKGEDILRDPHVSVVFPWYPMERQVSVEGSVEKLPREESEEYFASRPWGHQVGAIASDQSRPLASRAALEQRWRDTAADFPDGSPVPMPTHWGGYLIRPNRIEFWQGRYSRLHDRIAYERDAGGWRPQRLYP